MNNLALYIHWPFCKSKCPYCDFNSHVREKVNQKNWLKSYIKELEKYRAQLGERNITSIFFGGGTPSLMDVEVTQGIIEKIKSLWNVKAAPEITLEANPTSIEAEKLKDFKSAGINRLSMGIQSLNESDLKFLGREHSVNEAKKAIETAAEIFSNYSFDLIYARPNQTIAEWEKELNSAIKLACKHLSLYQLTIEKGTPFYSQYNKKEFQIPDEESAAQLYEKTQEICEKNGLPFYEISNHAAPGFECKHNLSYWNYDEYLGIGPGAHSRLCSSYGREAVVMVHDPDKWMKLLDEGKSPTLSSEVISGEKLSEEVLMMGLRLKSGLKKENFKQITGKDFEEVFNNKKTQKLISEGLIEENSTGIKATRKGFLVLNSIINYYCT